MNSRNEKILDQIRVEALEREIPEADVDRWMGLVRPCGLLTEDEDGPVVGRFGGPILLPADAAPPAYPLVVTIDCAALPQGATDLPLPSDGKLLFFGYPEQHGMGDVVYVPSGAAVEERDLDPSSYPACAEDFAEICSEFPQGDVHLTQDISLPFVGMVEASGHLAPLPGHPHSEELAEVWEDQWGGAPLLLGGYGTECNGIRPIEMAALCATRTEGETSPDADDWVLLAEFEVYRSGGGATIFWAIQRDDLIARRFDRAETVLDWNP